MIIPLLRHRKIVYFIVYYIPKSLLIIISGDDIRFLSSGTTFDLTGVFKIRHPVVAFCNDIAQTEEKEEEMNGPSGR
jgi:hypothetical protein